MDAAPHVHGCQPTARHSDLARHLLLASILSEQGAASYCPRGVFPVGTAGIKLLAGRPRDVSVAVAALAVLFVVKFALL